MKVMLESTADEFLLGLTSIEQLTLYNDLLALKEVHRLNDKNVYYTFRNFQHILKRHYERQKRSFTYKNKSKQELVIHQIHEQHFFKNTYKLQLFLDSNEFNYSLLEYLLASLAERVTTEAYYPQHALI